MSTLERVSEILALLPKDWFDQLRDVTLPGLMSLARFVAKLMSAKGARESCYKKGKEILKRNFDLNQVMKLEYYLYQVKKLES